MADNRFSVQKGNGSEHTLVGYLTGTRWPLPSVERSQVESNVRYVIVERGPESFLPIMIAFAGDHNVHVEIVVNRAALTCLRMHVHAPVP